MHPNSVSLSIGLRSTVRYRAASAAKSGSSSDTVMASSNGISTCAPPLTERSVTARIPQSLSSTRIDSRSSVTARVPKCLESKSKAISRVRARQNIGTAAGLSGNAFVNAVDSLNLTTGFHSRIVACAAISGASIFHEVAASVSDKCKSGASASAAALGRWLIRSSPVLGVAGSIKSVMCDSTSLQTSDVK
ncbi:Uncharacterised protein [Mycobacteroides abscessus subsp. abscessus]|nr:Uncharacterised protein [Mycobacteroides abscessus subsp. abscessus]